MKNLIIKLITVPLFILISTGTANVFITLELDNFWFWNWGLWMRVVVVVWYLSALAYLHQKEWD